LWFNLLGRTRFGMGIRQRASPYPMINMEEVIHLDYCLTLLATMGLIHYVFGSIFQNFFCFLYDSVYQVLNLGQVFDPLGTFPPGH